LPVAPILTDYSKAEQQQLLKEHELLEDGYLKACDANGDNCRQVTFPRTLEVYRNPPASTAEGCCDQAAA
jgi:hypothetical protein